MIVGLIFLAFTVAVQGQTTDVETCQLITDAELPINAYIEGCTTPPCLLPQLQDAVINIVFQAPRTMTSMRTLAAAIVHRRIISMPAITYPLGDNALTCNFLTNSFCPVLAGEVLQYTLKMFIESSFLVGTRATIEFKVVDEADQSVICIRVPITITPSVA
ncbi:uncharacterized protein LOC114361489 [Ostrinia furnacalis]|uniref:uncharacterized protein LOC114361489 n=1 Tax=Ostrinia furnacalis TaxID=93504 RepID=UPI001038C853|nr:uncharacterized protein LOC114361489 [Ostrinia furnacalis]